MRPAWRDDAATAGDLRHRLRHVYWIGGGSGAGKSTIAQHVADRYGMRVYGTDEVMQDHARRVRPELAPRLSRFAGMTMDERWMSRTPQEMLDTFHWFYGEGFDLIVEDLLGFPELEPVVVEGFRLLPDLVAPLLAERRRAVWLVPTPEFRQSVFDGRGGPAWGFLARTSDPRRALANLLERDRMFTDRLVEQARRHELATVVVDATVTEDALARRVCTAFGLDG